MKKLLIILSLLFFISLDCKHWPSPDMSSRHEVHAIDMDIADEDYLDVPINGNGNNYHYTDTVFPLLVDLSKRLTLSESPRYRDQKTRKLEYDKLLFNSTTGAIYPDTLDEINFFPKEEDYFMTKD